jgi:hypothetical protein
MKLFSLNCAQKLVVFKSKAVINLQIIEGLDFISPGAEICTGLANNFHQKLATTKSGAKDLAWLNICFFTAS